MKRFFSVILILNIFTQAIAETVVIDGGVRARETSDFHSTTNIKAMLTKGTEGEILERKEFPSGSYGLKIRIKKLGARPLSNLEVDDEVWIYYHKNPAVRLIEVYDDQHHRMNSPEKAKAAEVTQTHTLQTNVTHKKIKPKANASECCTPVEKPPEVVDEDKIKEQIANLDKFEKEKALAKFDDSSIPNLDVAAAELAQYIEGLNANDKWQDNDDLELNKKIAKQMIIFAKKDHVPVQMVLAIALQESHIRIHPAHHKGKRHTDHGMFQLIKSTELNLAKEVGLLPANATKEPDELRENWEANVQMGIHYIADAIKAYPNDRKLQFIYYNRGPGGAADFAKGRTKVGSSYSSSAIHFYNNLKDLIAETGLR